MVAHAFAKRGVTCVLVPLYEQAVDVPLLELDALIINYARPTNFALVQGYADMGLPVIVLDTEGGVLAENGANAPHTLAAYVKESGYSKLLAGYMFWGTRLHDAFVAGSAMETQRLFVTGCPRFDYASPRWQGTLSYPRQGYVLVNANFPLVNPKFVRSPEHERETLIRTGWKPEYVDVMLSDQRDILRGFIDTIGRVASELKDRQFVVRPHPFENIERYQQAFAHCTNVIVDGNGSVLNVIRNAACLVHLNCGTSIEATMLRRLPVSMEFLNTTHMAAHSVLPSRISRDARSVEELLDIIVNVPHEAENFEFDENYRNLIYPWFHENDGDAAERVAEAVTKIIGLKPAMSAWGGVRRSLAASRRAPRAGQRLQAALANMVGSATVARLRSLAAPARKQKLLKRADVETQIRLITEHAGTSLPRVVAARHPWTGVELSSLTVQPN